MNLEAEPSNKIMWGQPFISFNPDGNLGCLGWKNIVVITSRTELIGFFIGTTQGHHHHHHHDQRRHAVKRTQWFPCWTKWIIQKLSRWGKRSNLMSFLKTFLHFLHPKIISVVFLSSWVCASWWHSGQSYHCKQHGALTWTWTQWRC